MDMMGEEEDMAKSTTIYWDALFPENQEKWGSIRGLEGIAEELTLSIDDNTGEYNEAHPISSWGRYNSLRRKIPSLSGEVFIVSGRLYDYSFNQWLEPGHYASRPPGEHHGPFKTDVNCVVLEVSFPNPSVS